MITIKSLNLRSLLLLSVFISGFFVLVKSNNITVTNLTLSGQNTSAGINNASNFTMVEFDLSWNNSWRISSGPANWDAAWVFVKYRVGANNPTFTGVSLTNSSSTVTLSSTANLRVGMPVRIVSTSLGTASLPTGASAPVITAINSSTQVTLSANATASALNSNTLEFIRIWEHASLNSTLGNHSLPAGTSMALTADKMGGFLYRSSNGSGTLSLVDVKLRWDYGSVGVTDNTAISVQVFAIEMVYVPTGDFNVGGGGGTSAFTSTTINTATANTAPSGTHALGGAAGGYPTGTTAPNASYPNGYNAFYCMKYEISQGQYRDFLNSLSYSQQVNRTAQVPTNATRSNALIATGTATTNRNGLDIQTPANATSLAPAVYACNFTDDATFNSTNDGEWIACNYLSWMDGCAYLDWAGLRPMSELEYEKACRGNQVAVSGEYAWGNTTAIAAATIVSDGASNESISTASANIVATSSPSVQGPCRVGIFAGSATTRSQAGASYWGIMELSGNLSERVVNTTGNVYGTAGRSYTGVHGDGTLTINGFGNVDFWPGINGNNATTTANTAFAGTTGITNAGGSGERGGNWATPASTMTRLTVSDRDNAQPTSSDGSRASTYGFRGVRTAP